MISPSLIFSFLVVTAFTLTTFLEPWFQSWAGNRAQSANVLSVALGDSRRLFAKHFYVKADAYFHSGYYPTIYDNKPAASEMHMATQTGAGQAGHAEEGLDFLGQPTDWIDRFGRNFFPSQHRHLGEKAGGEEHFPGDGHDHHDDEDGAGEEAREILPWLRISAELDPQRVETYIVSSFWLRTQLGKVNEAEQFLREGLNANPGHCEILFELGRIYFENRKDATRARNVWELALRNWNESEGRKAEPNIFIRAQILGQLAKLEEEQKNYARAVEHLQALFVASPNKASLQKWIDELKAKK